MKDTRMRSPLAQARGLGSAKEGSKHWWTQRVTAVTLVPLTIWFMASLVMLTGGDHSVFLAWLRSPLNTVLMVTFVIVVFYHMALGLQVVAEDYLHDDGIKIPTIILIQIGCAVFTLTCIISIIRITV